jgi:WD40 repeat protein/Tfp pilus assembly protein PilF
MSSLQLNCPHCQVSVSAAESQRGQIICCPGCGTQLRVPEAPWHYQKNGQQFGPITRKRLRDLLSRGELQGTDLVRQVNAEQWIRAAEVVHETPSADPTLDFPSLHAPPTPTLEQEPARRKDVPLTIDSAPAATLPEAPGGSPPPLAMPAIGDYDLLEEISHGGMGIVYRARQRSAGRLVALKMLLAGQFASPHTLQRFRLEAQAAAQLQHPGIVPVYEVGEYDAGNGQMRPFFTMKLFEGGLHRRLGDFRDDPRAAARLMLTVARAVHHAHQHGLLHRDLKPSNILLDTEGNAHVGDFGLAKRFDDSDPSGENSSGSLTATGQIVGTPEYMAPEQARAARNLTTAVDVYGLGAVLYALFTGRPPFLRGDDLLDTVRAVLEDEPVSPRQTNPRIDRDLETICLKCLHKDSARRYASAEELARDLERYLAGEPIQARPVGALERTAKWVRRRPAIAGLLAAMLLVALTGLGAFIWQYNDALEQKHNAQREAFEKGAILGEKVEALNREKIAADLARTRAGELEIEKQRAQTKGEEASQSEKRALLSLDRLSRTLLTAQLVRAGALAAGDPDRALDLLENPSICPPGLRDFSWGLYYHQCRRDRWLLPEQQSSLADIALSRDGKTLAMRDELGALTLWNLPEGTLRVTLPGRWNLRTRLALSPDGKELFTAETLLTVKTDKPRPASRPLQRWDTTTGKEQETLWANQAIIGLSLTPDGQRLAAATMQPLSEAVKVWERSGGAWKEVRTLRDFVWAPEALALSPDGQRLAVATRGRNEGKNFDLTEIKLWDVKQGMAETTLPMTREWQKVHVLAFLPDGKTVLGAAHGVVDRWDATTGTPLEPLESAALPLISLALSDDGKTLAGAGSNGLAVWDLGLGRLRTTFRTARGPVAFLPGGKSLVSSSQDGSVRQWELIPEGGLSLLDEKTAGSDLLTRRFGAATRVGFTPDGHQLLLATRGSTLTVREAASGKTRFTLPGFLQTDRVAFSPDGAYLTVAGDANAKVRVHDARTGEDCGDLTRYFGPVQFSPDGMTCAVYEGRYQPSKFENETHFATLLWNLREKRAIALLDGVSDPVLFSADGRVLAGQVGRPKTADRGMIPAAVKVWDAHTGEVRAHFENAVALRAFSPDGKFVVCRAKGGMAVCSVATGQVQFPLPNVAENLLAEGFGSYSTPGHCTFTPDGALLAATGLDREVRLFDVARGAEIGLLDGHRAPVTALAFSPDGKTLATASSDQTVRLWDVAARRVRTVVPASPYVRSLSFTAGGRALALGGVTAPQGSVQLIDTANGKEISFRGDTGRFTQLFFSPTEDLVATSQGGDLLLWSTRTGKQTGLLEGRGFYLHPVGFSEDGKKLLAGDGSGPGSTVWDLTTSPPTPAYVGFWQRSQQLTVSNNGAWLVRRNGADVTLSDLATDQPQARFRDTAGNLLFGQGGRCAVPLRRDGKELVEIHDVKAGRLLATLPGARAPLFFLRGGAFLVSGFSGNLKLWNTEAGKELPLPAGVATVLAVSPDGGQVVVRCDGKEVLLWDVTRQETRARLPEATNDADFSGDGKRLALAAGTDAVLLDARTGEEIRKLPHLENVRAVALRPDGQALATNDDRGNLRLWDVDSGREKYRVAGRFTASGQLTFRADGKALRLGAAPNSMPLLDADTGAPFLSQIAAHDMQQWSEDGKTAARVFGQTVTVVDATMKRVRLTFPVPFQGGLWWLSPDSKRVSFLSGQRILVFDSASGEQVAGYHLHPWSAQPLDDRLRYSVDPGADRRQPQLTLWDPENGRQRGRLIEPDLVPSGARGPLDNLIQALGLSADGALLAVVTGGAQLQVQVWELPAGRLRDTLALPRDSMPNRLRFSHDNKFLIGLAFNNVVRWDLSTKRFRVLLVAGPPVSSHAMIPSPDGAHLALVTRGKPDPKTSTTTEDELSLLNLTTEERRLIARMPYSLFGVLSFAPDGKNIAWLSQRSLKPDDPAPHELTIYDVLSGERKQRFQPPAGSLPFLTWCHDGKTLAAGHGSDGLMLWDATTGKDQQIIKGVGQPSTCVLSSDGKLLIRLRDTAQQNRVVEVGETKSGKVVETLPWCEQRFAFAPAEVQASDDGRTVALRMQNQLLVWDRAEQRQLLLSQGSAQASQFSLSHDGRTLVLCHQPTFSFHFASLSVWDAASGKVIDCPYTESGTTLAAVSPDGQTVVFAGSRGPRLHLFDVATRQVRKSFVAHDESVAQVAFAPDGATFASCGGDRTVKVWDARTGALKTRFAGHTVGVSMLSYSLDGKTLTSVGHGGLDAKTQRVPLEVIVWNLATGKEQARHTPKVTGFRNWGASADGLVFATAQDKQARVWDVTTGHERGAIPELHEAIRDIAVSPDGQFLGVLGVTGAVRLYETATGKERGAAQDKANQTIALNFSPDGRTLLAAVADGGSTVVRRYGVPSGEALPALSGRKANGYVAHTRVERVLRAANGRLLVTLSPECINLWEMQPGPKDTLNGRWRASFPLPPSDPRVGVASAPGVVLGEKLLVLNVRDNQGGSRLQLLDLETLAERETLADAGASSFAISPDDRFLAWVTSKGELLLRDVASRKTVLTHPFPSDRVPGQLAFSRDGKTLGALAGGEVLLLDTATRKIAHTLTAPPGRLPVQLAPGAQTAFAVVRDEKHQRQTVLRWDLATRQAVGRGDEIPLSTTLATNGDLLAELRFEHGLRFLEASTLEERRFVPWPSPDFAFDQILRADEERLIVRNRGKEPGKIAITLLDPRTHKELQSIVWNSDVIYRPAFSPDGRVLALIGADKPATGFGPPTLCPLVGLWDVMTGRQLGKLVHDKAVRSVAFSSDGKTLATGSGEEVHLWDVATRQKRRTLARMPGRDPEVAGFLLGDRLMLLRAWPGDFRSGEVKNREDWRLWDVEKDRLHAVLDKSRSVAAIHPDGQTVATIHTEGEDTEGYALRIWDALTGQERAFLRGPRRSIEHLWFAPDGQALFSASGGWSEPTRWPISWPDPARQHYLRGNACLWRNHPLLRPASERPSRKDEETKKELRKNLDLALGAYHEALRHQPDYAPALEAILRLQARTSPFRVRAADAPKPEMKPDREEVRSVVCRLLEQQPHRADLRYQMALVLLDEDPPAALAELRQAVACDPQHFESRADLAALLWRQGQVEEAVATYRVAMKLSAEDYAANRDFGKLLLDLGRSGEAVGYLRVAVAGEQATESAARLGLGEALAHRGDVGEALAVYQAIDLRQAPQAGWELARLLGNGGRWAEAVAVYRRLRPADPGWQMSGRVIVRRPGTREPGNLLALSEAARLLELAQALRRGGQMLEAQATYKQALDQGAALARPWIHDPGRLRDLEARLRALLAGKEKPAGSEEMIELAYLCGYKNQPADALHFFRMAFAAQPALAQDVHRFPAACTALLVAANGPEDAQELRRQALEWLRAELDDLRQRPVAHRNDALTRLQTLEHWYRQPDLASVREARSLAVLPEQERAAWERLWSDLAAVRQRFDSVPLGRWRREGQELIQEDTNGETLLCFGDVAWGDCSIEFEARTDQGSEVSVLFRVRSFEDCHLAVFGGWDNTHHAVLRWDASRSAWSVLGRHQPGKTETGRWQKVRVEVRDSQGTLYLDGQRVHQVQLDTTKTTGRVGLRTWNSAVRFRNLHVTDPQGNVLFAGVPPIP